MIRALKVLVIVVAAMLAAALALDRVFPPPIPAKDADGTVVLDRDGRWLHAFPAAGGMWRFPADLDGIDPSFVRRVVAVEDARFYFHPGVDPAALGRAALSWARAGRIVSGGSTITMQVARLLEPRPRTISSKLIEMFRALQIEARLSKREILELYLTRAPYGGNIEGVRAASLTWFGKEPDHLSDAEQALLIALPQAPEARRPDRRPQAARAARNRILEKLTAKGLLSSDSAAYAQAAATPVRKHIYPHTAYHAAYKIARDFSADKDPGGDIRSTLDLILQRRVESLVRAAAERAGASTTAAAVVVDVKTREVRALAGSAGFDIPGGWIDLTAARRSPGSALKPFIYAMALDDGLAAPETLIEDAPHSYSGYAPENFDRVFHGEVRLADALQHSLNAPAVATLDKVGPARFDAALSAAGVRLALPDRGKKKAGLAIALGGAGITARGLATLYAGLAGGGVVKPLVWRVKDKTGEGRRLVSQGAAERIGRILRTAPAIEGRAPSMLSRSAPKVAFKTGTSWGFRDAWSAGYTDKYAIVVWVGRADGAPRPGATGREAAAPLLFDLFDAATTGPDLRVTTPDEENSLAAMTLARLSPPRVERAPQIVFPPDGVDIPVAEFGPGARGLALAARDGAGKYRWYVDGAPAPVDPVGGRTIWRPETPGFYELSVVDAAGRSARARVRVSAAMGG